MADNTEYCVHARFCMARGTVWQLTEDSDNTEAHDLAVHESMYCPSGRLKLWDKEEEKFYEPPLKPALGLIEDPQEECSGPLWVKGGIPVNGPNGTEYEQRNRVTLCRCGASANKPYCDGTHVTVHFQDHLPLSTELEEKMKETDTEELFKTIEMPLSEVLADMQYQGIYVDKEKLACDFESQSFQDFLSFAAGLPDDVDYENLDSQPIARAYVGEQPILIRQIGSSAIVFLSFTDTIFGGQAQYVGFPAESSSGVALLPHALVSMSASSPNKEGVMDFIYFILSPEAQTADMYCPIIQSLLDERMELWEEKYLEQPPILNTYFEDSYIAIEGTTDIGTVSYTHLTLPTILLV